MKLKVCGMKSVENIKSIADLNPDYMGFIFYDESKRNFEGIIPELPRSIKKTGVFVNEYVEIVVSLIEEYKLEAVQLHGDESVAYIQQLKEGIRQAQLDSVSHKRNKKQAQIEIIKVFAIKDNFDFEILKPYENEVDYFLFDTKGEERGGNGVKFDWSVLKEYPYSKPFFLSGGIGPNDAEQVKEIKVAGMPIYAVDVNSKFESKPGVKNSNEVKNFKKQL
tara:strand:- start:3627 stop:4289 length:663 start_codon:yes stop_codon:yes gene_type:complete